MDFEAQLRAEHSKRNMEFMASYIGSNRKRLQDFLKVFDSNDDQLAQRAAWVLGTLAEYHPEVMESQVAYLVSLLDKPFHPAIRRNVLRAFEFVNVPYSLMGTLADKCFYYLNNLDEPAAVKAFAMTVLYKICLSEPGLKHEVRLVIEDMLPLGGPAIQSRGKKVLKQLAKIKES